MFKFISIFTIWLLAIMPFALEAAFPFGCRHLLQVIIDDLDRSHLEQTNPPHKALSDYQRINANLLDLANILERRSDFFHAPMTLQFPQHANLAPHILVRLYAYENYILQLSPFMVDRTTQSYFSAFKARSNVHEQFYSLKNQLMDNQISPHLFILGGGNLNSTQSFLKELRPGHKPFHITTYSLHQFNSDPIALEKLHQLETEKGHVSLKLGQKFESFNVDELLKEKHKIAAEKSLNRPIFMDYFGVFTYTLSLEQALKNLFAYMEEGDLFWIYNAGNQRLLMENGETLSLLEFLSRFPAFETLVFLPDQNLGLFKRTRSTIKSFQLELMSVELDIMPSLVWKYRSNKPDQPE